MKFVFFFSFESYISVNRDTQEATIWTYRIMGYLLSQKLPHVKEENCTYLPRFWFAGYKNQGECGVTTQNYSVALSPAFIIEGNRLVLALKIPRLATDYFILFYFRLQLVIW